VQLADFPLLEAGDMIAETGEGDAPLRVVNFWASWCPPCRAEHPTLTALAEAGNPLFGINYRDRPDQALSFLADLGNPFDALGQDPMASTGRDWGVIALPETFFLDAEGTVVLHFRGPITARVLDTQIRPALAERGHELPPLPQ
ncbi:MAG: DsbE family thiol:disulfide interchange protein, partial [Pseudomonadota bacterium]